MARHTKEPARFVSDREDGMVRMSWAGWIGLVCSACTGGVEGEKTGCVPGDEIPYDGIDQDCDGADLVDLDGDGFDAEVVGGDDCEDEDPGVHPGATEVAYDGIDQDCDGLDLVDVDGDGFDAIEAGGDDCDDADPAVFPGAAEAVGNDHVDSDCDGYYDGTAPPTAEVQGGSTCGGMTVEGWVSDPDQPPETLQVVWTVFWPSCSGSTFWVEQRGAVPDSGGRVSIEVNDRWNCDGSADIELLVIDDDGNGAVDQAGVGFDCS